MFFLTSTDQVIDLRSVVAIDTTVIPNTTRFVLASGHVIDSPHADNELAIQEKWNALRDMRILAGECIASDRPDNAFVPR
jgi:hypothetical protein